MDDTVLVAAHSWEGMGIFLRTALKCPLPGLGNVLEYQEYQMSKTFSLSPRSLEPTVGLSTCKNKIQKLLVEDFRNYDLPH